MAAVVPRVRHSADSPIEYVQIDGQVVLKIIKHCHEDGAGTSEVCQGVLLGLVVDTCLQITNCFPFPRHNDDDEFDEVDYQMEMMRHLRQVNIDHLHVGWYQSTYYGGFLNKALLDSQYSYQSSIEESVVLIYDPLKTTRGFLSVKAYRLTPTAMQMYREGDFTPESVKTAKLSFESMFDEIRVVVRNSHLVSIMLCELQLLHPEEKDSQFLDLATCSVLEKNLRSLMDCVDELSQEANKFVTYQKQAGKLQQAKQQYLQKRQQEASGRAARGEAPLPEEDINKLFRPIPVPPRLDSLLYSGQINAHCQQIGEFAAQSIGKLFMADSLQLGKNKTLPTLP